MSKIQFDVDVANGVAIDIANNVLPIWRMEVCPFHFNQSKSLLHAEIKWYEHLIIQDKKENNEKKEKLKDPVAGGSTDADKHWLSNTLTDEILEQVGRELVAECFKSTFLPNVLGIIFVRTEVSNIHAHRMKRNGNLHKTKSTCDVHLSIHSFKTSQEPQSRSGRASFGERLLMFGAQELKAHVSYCDYSMSFILPLLNFHIFDFFSKTAEQILTKLERK